MVRQFPLITLILISLSIFSKPDLFAKTFYVNSLKGDDSNSGTSPRNAWKSIQIINDQTFLPGDSILFQAGLGWRGELDIRSSGTPTKPITISVYGHGNKPKIMGSESPLNWEKRFKNIWISDFNVKPGCIWFVEGNRINWGRYKESVSELKKQFDYSWQDNKLYIFLETGYNTDDFYIECSVRNFGIISGWYGNKADFIKIDNIEVCFTKNANIRAVGSVGWNVENCILHHSGVTDESEGQGLQFEGKKGTFSDNLIFENGQHGIFISAFGNAQVRNIVIENNIVYNNYHTGIDLMNDRGGIDQLRNVTIRRNRIYDTEDFEGKEIGIQTLGYGDGYLRNLLIHHNIIYNIKGIGISIMQNSDSVSVHNNSVVNTESACININNNNLYAEVFNNMSQNSVYYAVGFLHSKKNKFIDNNIWFSKDTNIVKNIFLIDRYFTNIKEYRRESGFDNNGEFKDPEIIYAGNFPVCIERTSICVDKAKQLNYSSDFHGNDILDRPDIGACEVSD